MQEEFLPYHADIIIKWHIVNTTPIPNPFPPFAYTSCWYSKHDSKINTLSNSYRIHAQNTPIIQYVHCYSVTLMVNSSMTGSEGGCMQIACPWWAASVWCDAVMMWHVIPFPKYPLYILPEWHLKHLPLWRSQHILPSSDNAILVQPWNRKYKELIISHYIISLLT